LGRNGEKSSQQKQIQYGYLVSNHLRFHVASKLCISTDFDECSFQESISGDHWPVCFIGESKGIQKVVFGFTCFHLLSPAFTARHVTGDG
jgi:hypothetical protein